MIFCRLGCDAASKKDFAELEFQGIFVSFKSLELIVYSWVSCDLSLRDIRIVLHLLVPLFKPCVHGIQ